MNIRSTLREGLLVGFINFFLILLGIPGLIGKTLESWFDLPSQTLGVWLLLLIVAAWGGARAARSAQSQKYTAALVASGTHGLFLAVFIWIVSTLTNAGAEIRKWLVQLHPEAVDQLTFGLSPLLAALLMLGAMIVAGLVGVVLSVSLARYRERRAQADGGTKTLGEQIRAVPAVGRFIDFKYSLQILYGIGLVILLVAPLLLGQYWNYTLGTVGIYVILGLGLNIVVGLAGLLDLGYVAFFAIGAYTVAILTAPTPHGIGMNFWLVLPIGVVLAALSGILLGIPVLRMRGDYLAIVTLGFGEIIRILSKSDLLTGFTGGPRGIRAVGGPSLFGLDINNEFYFMYLIILGIMLVAFITSRLQNSRVGRAWMAMREDEDVAEAMGIYTLKYKLLAFSIGAAFAGLGGVIFASRNQFTGPEDFTLLVSINVLCLVIIGGMGSIPGVVLGAMVLKGLPEILRELDDYRMLVFGALLIVTMIVRPEGLWPSQRKRMELHKADDEAALDTAASSSTGAA
jgi:ABC-type branched-subunit amino acid transport system permease subunit